MDSVDQRSDCTFSAVWSWSTLSTKAPYVFNGRKRVTDKSSPFNNIHIFVHKCFRCGEMNVSPVKYFNLKKEMGLFHKTCIHLRFYHPDGRGIEVGVHLSLLWLSLSTRNNYLWKWMLSPPTHRIVLIGKKKGAFYWPWSFSVVLRASLLG